MQERIQSTDEHPEVGMALEERILSTDEHVEVGMALEERMLGSDEHAGVGMALEERMLSTDEHAEVGKVSEEGIQCTDVHSEAGTALEERILSTEEHPEVGRALEEKIQVTDEHPEVGLAFKERILSTDEHPEVGMAIEERILSTDEHHELGMALDERIIRTDEHHEVGLALDESILSTDEKPEVGMAFEKKILSTDEDPEIGMASEEIIDNNEHPDAGMALKERIVDTDKHPGARKALQEMILSTDVHPEVRKAFDERILMTVEHPEVGMTFEERILSTDENPDVGMALEESILSTDEHSVARKALQEMILSTDVHPVAGKDLREMILCTDDNPESGVVMRQRILSIHENPIPEVEQCDQQALQEMDARMDEDLNALTIQSPEEGAPNTADEQKMSVRGSDDQNLKDAQAKIEMIPLSVPVTDVDAAAEIVLSVPTTLESAQKELVQLSVPDTREDVGDHIQKLNETVILDEKTEEKKMQNQSEGDGAGERKYFGIKAASLAVFVPCVVGKTKYTFLVISLSSFFTRTIALILALYLSHLKVLPGGSFLFHCVPSSVNLTNTPTCKSISTCFASVVNGTEQKVRVCGGTGEEEDILLKIFGMGIVIAGVFSLIATYLLHKMTKYEHLFAVSQTCCWMAECPIIPCFLKTHLAPIIHRSTIFSILDNHQDDEAAAKIQEVFTVASRQKEKLSNIASRPLLGQTALISSVAQNKTKSAEVLLKNGAAVEENEDGEHPLNIATSNRDSEMVKILLEHGAKIQEDKSGEHPYQISVMNKDEKTQNVFLDNIDKPGHSIKYFIKSSDHDALKTLLDNGANVEASDIQEAVIKKDDKTIELLMRYTTGSHNGIVHSILNTGGVISLLANTQLGEERKERMMKRMKNIIPEENVTDDEVAKLLIEWNKSNTLQIVLGKMDMSDNAGRVVTPSSSSSDKMTSHNGQKQITAIQVKVITYGLGVRNLRVRYDGDAWGAWHNTYYYVGGDAVTHELLLGEGEIVTSVQTGYYSGDGYLRYLVVTTSAGRRWEQGDSGYGDSVRGDFVARGRSLAYITSDTGDSNTYFRTVFHWQ